MFSRTKINNAFGRRKAQVWHKIVTVLVACPISGLSSLNTSSELVRDVVCVTLSKLGNCTKLSYFGVGGFIFNQWGQ